MNTSSSTPQGLTIARRFTTAGRSPYDQFTWSVRDSILRDATGQVVHQLAGIEVPEAWSQTATDILAQKYLRRTGVPQPDGTTGSETSARQAVHRLASTWRHWGEQHGYFATDEDAQAFYDELVFLLLDQRAAPNSPQWFNTGLHHVYGIDGPAQGHYYADAQGHVHPSTSAYERPQPHACFILSVQDDLVNPGGIMDLFTREARVFKYGSGSGTNFSSLRGAGEPLSGGGTSSGVMSFLQIGDRAAGAIKSGGTTRRAAKMVILDVDHPEIEAFIRWKAEEERKVAALIAAGYPADYEGEAYRTVSGQNANNSVRVTEAFLQAVELNTAWHTTARVDGRVMGTYQARDLWEQMAQAAWRSADPGLQYHDTINAWHTCPTDGPIRASNPCSEYLFLDDTACNLASLNLQKFLDTHTLRFDVEGYLHSIRLLTIVLEISVLMAQYPSPEVARRSWEYRTLGLGYANLGGLLMASGLPYDSPRGRAIAGALTAMLTGKAYETSAELARALGPFAAYERNREPLLRVLRNHRYAAYNASTAYEDLPVPPLGLDATVCPADLHKAACDAWDRALQLGEQHGFRNAQVSVLAPTGTIGLLMDCDTTGIEPDFALVKFKKLAGGGFLKMVNQMVPTALRSLGYTEAECAAVVRYVVGSGTLVGAPYLNPESLRALGFTEADLAALEARLPAAADLESVFSVHTLGAATLQRLGTGPEGYQAAGFSLLRHLGFTPQQLEEATDYVCGTHTVEGAPHLKPEHLPVFDCANRQGRTGKRFIHPHGHLLMMAAAQSFISGAISKTINLPHEATWQEIAECYRLGWKLGLKAISVYRDGAKLSQPLNTTGSTHAAEATQPMPELATPDGLFNAVQTALRAADATELQRRLQRLVNKRPLPYRRGGFTQKVKVAGQTLYVRTGEYHDGTLGEVFIDMAKEGATLRSLMNCLAIAVSIGLQYGVPLEEYVDKFAFTRFEPAGPVEGHPNLKNATSIIDLIFRMLAVEYLGRTDLAHVVPDATAPAPPEESSERYLATLHEPTPVYYAAQKPPRTVTAPAGADAPACAVCGHLTVRTGTCYSCTNCGTSMGCG